MVSNVFGVDHEKRLLFLLAGFKFGVAAARFRNFSLNGPALEAKVAQDGLI